MRGAIAVAILLANGVSAQVAEVATVAMPSSGGAVALTERMAAVACGDKTLRLWTLPEGKLVRSIELGERAIDVMAISADGRWVAAGDHGSRYTVWDTTSGAVQMQLKLAHYPASMAFSRDARRLAIAPMGDAVQIYELATRKKLFELQNPVGGTAAVVFSHDGGRIATADADTVVRVYDARNGELISRNPDFLLVPLTVAFTADGKSVLAGGGDKAIALLDAATGRGVRASEKAEDAIAYLETSPDGALLAAVLMHSDNMMLPGPLVISEVATGKTVQEWRPASLLVGGAWTSDGHLLAATMEKKALHVWRVR
jgi:WD40 repeat protein